MLYWGKKNLGCIYMHEHTILNLKHSQLRDNKPSYQGISP